MKKTAPRIAGMKPKTPKSYHSMQLPMADAATARRTPRSSGSVGASCAVVTVADLPDVER